ncbi:MAG: SDR family oxidoreductase [Deltaproteobacteria bacterium]|nr:SDR family oxidoreductase [Deltaproteobacteria bacterium]
MAIDFKGKVAIITGAGAGLGRAHALGFAKLGAKVVVNDLGAALDGTGGSSEAAMKVVAEIKAAGGEAIANGASVSDPVGAESIVKDALKAFGRVDVLVNNAGILRDKTFKKTSREDFQIVVDVHLMGAVNVTKAVWTVMEEQQYGRIVMTTSSSGLYGNFGQANYASAKMGLVGLVKTLKHEGKKKNIRVNAIAPTSASRMTETMMTPDMLEKLKPELVTPAVLYLSSEDAPSGMILEAGGGYFAKVEVVETKGVKLGFNVTADDVAANIEKICDMNGAANFDIGPMVVAKILTP